MPVNDEGAHFRPSLTAGHSTPFQGGSKNRSQRVLPPLPEALPAVMVRAAFDRDQRPKSTAERWQSGRLHRTRNAAYSQGYRGFKSLPLRHFLAHGSSLRPALFRDDRSTGGAPGVEFVFSFCSSAFSRCHSRWSGWSVALRSERSSRRPDAFIALAWHVWCFALDIAALSGIDCPWSSSTVPSTSA